VGREEGGYTTMVYINIGKESDLEYHVENNGWIVNVETWVKSGILIHIPKGEVV
jgi:hypothetical protein